MKTLSSEGVKSINGKSGTVVITTTDVGAPSLSEFTVFKDIVNRMKKRVLVINHGVLVGDYAKGSYKTNESV